MSIKCIFFDYGGTLDAHGIAWKERFYSIYREYGLDIPFDRFVKAFYASDDSLVAEGLKEENLTATAFEQTVRVLKNLGIEDDTGELAKNISGRFVSDSLMVAKENIPVLERLANSYRLGVISNNYGNIEAICRECGLDTMMEVMIDSNVVGHEKPDPAIFYAALDAVKLDAEECVMVGDNIMRDINGALSVGMMGVLLCASDRIDTVDSSRFHVIGRLSELEEIL